MGPILQERATTTASTTTTHNKHTSKERKRTNMSGNKGPVISSKQGTVNQNFRPQKKTSVQPKHPSSRQVKDSMLVPETGLGRRRTRVKPEASTIRDTRTSLHSDRVGEFEPKATPLPSTEVAEERSMPLENPGQSQRNLSFPVAPQSDERQEPPKGRAADWEPLRTYEEKGVDTDSCSDLSDSERLPVAPSPCTPPLLNLRPEVINPSHFYADLPGPPGLSHGGCYPDFLPPPFNSWSLQQLAIFLNTDDRGAFRPRPVGHLEKYLDRLLQLEWLKIQTVEEENGRPVTAMPAHRPRPLTAPPTCLSSPKSLHQCQRAFPLAFLTSLAVPSPRLPSGRACPHCHIRYPFCNGTCRFYAYQLHSRFSPLLERRTRASLHPKRCSSEGRFPAADTSPASFGQKHGSPRSGNSYLKRMQAAGNIRNPLGGQRATSKLNSVSSCAGTGTSRKGVTGESGSSNGHLVVVSPMTKNKNKTKKVGSAVWDSKPGAVSAVEDPSLVSRGCPIAGPSGRVKHVKFVTM